MKYNLMLQDSVYHSVPEEAAVLAEKERCGGWRTTTNNSYLWWDHTHTSEPKLAFAGLLFDSSRFLFFFYAIIWMPKWWDC